MQELSRKTGVSAFLMITLIVLAILMAGSGVWYYMNNKVWNTKHELQTQIDDLQKEVNDLKTPATSTTTTPAATATTSNDADPTAGWKTYTNTNHGFTIKYPNDWSITDTMQPVGQASSIAQMLKISKAGSSISIYFEPDGWGSPTPQITYLASVVNNKLTLTERTQVYPEAGGIAQEEGLVSLMQGNSFALTLAGHRMAVSASDAGLTNENSIVQILSSMQFTK